MTVESTFTKKKTILNQQDSDFQFDWNVRPLYVSSNNGTSTGHQL